MTYLVGKIAVPIPRSLPLLAGIAFVIFMAGWAIVAPLPPLPHVTVAFIGNSMMYYNDLPRLMERLADGHIVKDSCLHGSASLSTLLVWGNGQYEIWATGNARFALDDDTVELIDDDEVDIGLMYDYGACTVHQLFFGYDEDLDTRVADYNGDDEIVKSDDFFSFQDGKNPCLQNYYYYLYLQDKYERDGTPHWDFVVINDNTREPSRTEPRASSLKVLESTYLPWLLEMGSTPIFISTYAYDTPYRDMTGLIDVPSFTSYTYAGYREYAAFLEQNLPPEQKPRIAKVGWAFLLVWEEQYDLWKRLFHVDYIHASPSGSYLQALVVYHTIFGRLPPRGIALRADSSSMWDNARRQAPPNHRRGSFPTPEEERYLWDVASLICMYNVKPSSLTLYENGESVEYTPNDDPYHVDDIF